MDEPKADNGGMAMISAGDDNRNATSMVSRVPYFELTWYGKSEWHIYLTAGGCGLRLQSSVFR